jgi:hypothetical protein
MPGRDGLTHRLLAACSSPPTVNVGSERLLDAAPWSCAGGDAISSLPCSWNDDEAGAAENPGRGQLLSRNRDDPELGSTLCFMADVLELEEAASPYGNVIKLGPTLGFMTDETDVVEAASPYGDAMKPGSSPCFMTDVPDLIEAASPYGEALMVGPPSLCFEALGLPSLLLPTDRLGLTLPKNILFVVDTTDRDVVVASNGEFPSLVSPITGRGLTL